MPLTDCTLADCPAGLFLFGECLGFKSQYRMNSGGSEAFAVESGEIFWGNAKSAEERENLIVIPLRLEVSR